MTEKERNRRKNEILRLISTAIIEHDSVFYYLKWNNLKEARNRLRVANTYFRQAMREAEKL